MARLVQAQLAVGGHAVVAMRRPLAVLAAARRTAWDLVVVDDSVLGRDVLVVLPGVEGGEAPIIGIGLEDLRLSQSLALPLDLQAFSRAVDTVTARRVEPLVLRSDRRVAQANGREVVLTRIEFRLLEALMASRPREVSVEGAMEAIWGASADREMPASLRSHVRNLRTKLGQIGLANSLRSRRGRGYSLSL